MDAPTVLCELLAEAFPEWQDLPGGCWVRQAMERNSDGWSSAIRSVPKSGGRALLLERLQREHPPKRRSDAGADEALHAVFGECEAFAWAAKVAELPNPRFEFLVEGSPDVLCDGPVWVEAKTIRPSDDDREAERAAFAKSAIGFRMADPIEASPGLFRKFEMAFSDGLRKFSRVSEGPKEPSFVLFFHVLMFDLEVNDKVFDRFSAWAREHASQTNVRIVLVFNFRWEAPWFDSASV